MKEAESAIRGPARGEGQDGKRRAAEALEKAMKKLKEQLK